MSQIPIEKQVFNKTTFPKVIDTQFSQLISSVVEELPQFTIDDFLSYMTNCFIKFQEKVL